MAIVAAAVATPAPPELPAIQVRGVTAEELLARRRSWDGGLSAHALHRWLVNAHLVVKHDGLLFATALGLESRRRLRGSQLDGRTALGQGAPVDAGEPLDDVVERAGDPDRQHAERYDEHHSNETITTAVTTSLDMVPEVVKLVPMERR